MGKDTTANQPLSTRLIKRKPGSKRRTDVQWAWEFLRRNADYRKCYANWNELRHEGGEKFTTLELALIGRALDDLGFWRQRYEPWVRAGMESKKRFINWGAEDNSGIRTVVSDHTLDPMAFLLNRWLDPEESILPADEVFDLAATLNLRIVSLACGEYQALRDLGLLPPTVFDDFAETLGGFDIVVGDDHADLHLTFNSERPIGPQILQATKLLMRLQKGWLYFFDSLNRELSGLTVLDKGGSYNEALTLLDTRERCSSLAHLFRAVSNDKKLNSKDPEYRRLEKSYKTAKYLCDVGYATLAFHSSSKMVDKLLKWAVEEHRAA